MGSVYHRCMYCCCLCAFSTKNCGSKLRSIECVETLHPLSLIRVSDSMRASKLHPTCLPFHAQGKPAEVWAGTFFPRSPLFCKVAQDLDVPQPCPTASAPGSCRHSACQPSSQEA
jgi:hypothetical protein